MIKKFRETGSLMDKNLNRQKSVLTPGILQDIQTAITRYPHKYLRKLSAQTGISLGSAYIIYIKTQSTFKLNTRYIYICVCVWVCVGMCVCVCVWVCVCVCYPTDLNRCENL
jgi:hypothetical protein